MVAAFVLKHMHRYEPVFHERILVNLGMVSS